MLEEFTQIVSEGESLTEAQAEQSLELILSEDTPDDDIASLLTALAVKGESPAEIVGFARVMRRQAIPVGSHHSRLIDTAGRPPGQGGRILTTAGGEDLSLYWARVRSRLRAEFGDSAYSSWLKPMILADRRDSKLRIAVPTRFMRDWVADNYGERIREVWVEENDKVTDVEFIVAPPSLSQRSGEQDIALQSDQIAASPRTYGDRRTAGGRSHASAGGGEAWYENMGAPVDSRLTFSNFIVGKPNELAYAAARRVAEAASVPFNPLFLYGGVGLGKTHLMHAIAGHICNRQPARKVIYLSAEKFMYQFIRALRHKDTVAFKDQFRSVDVLMIDDVQFISGKESTQEEFFHTFNALVDQNRQVVISADKSTVSARWLSRKARHVCDGGFGCRTMYLATVVSDTS